MIVAETLFDKLWRLHRVATLPGEVDLLHVDRHLMHELTGVAAMAALEQRGLPVFRPALTFATVDHVISTRARRDDAGQPAGDEGWSTVMVDDMRAGTTRHGIRRFDTADGTQGIVHVIGPELGLSLPGSTIVCGDSHTCTHGAFGALAWGIGSSEVLHVLATQTIRQRRPKTMRVTFDGTCAPGVTAKDMVLALIGRLGAAAGIGYAVEFAGPAIRALDMEARMSLCNMAIEFGTRFGLIAPDETTFAYLRGRPFSPPGAGFDNAVAHWRTLVTDADAVFDREVTVDTGAIRAQVSWGTSPEHVIDIDGTIPDPRHEPDPARRDALQAALDYMALRPGDALQHTPIHRVFIGSCANSRLSDLQAAADVVRGRHVSPSVRAWVVPGSQQVRTEAERLGLDRIFLDAGFEWRTPGCSMCVGANGDVVGPGERCVSTSNRNFVGRQGPGARTHLASPAVAAASAIAGRIVPPSALALIDAEEHA